MRTHVCLLLVLSMLTTAHLAAAQQATPAPPAAATTTAAASAPFEGEADFGGRASSISGDAARFQKYRDVRTGPTLDRARYQKRRERWEFNAALEQAGYRDQRYTAGFNQYGKLKASFQWDQIPLFYSTDTRTPFTSPSAGVFRLTDAFQTAVQSASATTAIYGSDLRRFDLRSQRNTADARLDYRATRTLDLRVSFTSTGRTGAQPWGASFGQSNAVELAAPIDRRNNDMNATAEWSNDRAMARLAYDGSWFTNHIDRLIFDNPLRATDAVGLPSQGQQAQWPDSTAHTVSAAGSLALPARTRAFGYVSVGSWLQNDALLPFTINTAIAPLPLSRPTAEADARIVAMNYRLTSRPTTKLWLNGQFRSYNYDNRTPRFLEAQYVGLDSSLVTSATGGSEPFGYVRHFVDLDASYSPLTFAAVRLGYGRERDDRTFRHFEATTEHTVRASLDSTALSWGSMRLQYEHGGRTGQGLDEEVFSDIGEQVSLRQFDISNRRRDRLMALVQVVPIAPLGFSASAGVGQEHRPGASFGLQDNGLRTFSVGVDATRKDALVLGTEYSFEHYATLQHSRQANPGPQFDDPTRDWSTDMNENVHTVTSSLDLPHVARRTAARLAYDYIHANARYVYLLPSNTTLAQPQPLAPVRNTMQRATADVRYSLSRQVGIGAAYWYDSYDAQDFARSPGTLDSPFFPALINLMYLNRPYRAHTASVRLIYMW
jgi:MtrB/PioB family decaheme-associated outer membrane protein